MHQCCSRPRDRAEQFGQPPAPGLRRQAVPYELLSQPLASNPHILNHAVSLDNHCVEPIRVKVCYYNSDECTDVQVPPHGVKEQIIGVFPAMQQFRYEVKELF
jgi:hypothetical protein